MNNTQRPLLVLDLDNTLIYCDENPYTEQQISTEYGSLSIRDGVSEFLDKVAQHYDLMIWSNSGKAYIQAMLEHFWPAHVPLIDVFTSSESRIKGIDGMGVPFYKDMKKICRKHQDYPLARIVGVDDLPETYRSNFGNLIAISPFRGKPDCELEKLSGYLIKLSTKENFRKVEKRYWRAQAPTFSSGPSLEY